MLLAANAPTGTSSCPGCSQVHAAVRARLQSPDRLQFTEILNTHTHTHTQFSCVRMTCCHTVGQWVLRTPDQDPARHSENKKKTGPQFVRLSTDGHLDDSGGLARLGSEEWGQEQNMDRSGSSFSMEYATPVREVLKAARRETLEYDDIGMRKRSESQMDGSLSPILRRLPARSQTNVGTYTDMKTMGRTGVMTQKGDKTDRKIDPRTHLLEEECKRHQDTLPQSLHDHVAALSKGPVFFKPQDLVDPMQRFRDRERRFKRDGSLRDRLGRGENEAVIRTKLRSHETSAMDGPIKELPKKGDPRVKAEDVPREVRRALALLEGGPSPRSTAAGGPTTPIDSRLVFDRMYKGQTSWDVKLLAGREMCVLPKVETEVHDSASKADTRSLPTKQMIQAHASMLDEKAREATKAGCEAFQVGENKKVKQLRKDSWDVVKRWEERLAALPRMKRGLMELCCISIGWQGELSSHSALISAILRTGLDERAQRVLAMPEIRNIMPHHKDSLASEGRRKQIAKTLDALFGKKMVITQLRSRLQHYFKEFRIEWEDAVPMLDALSMEDLEVCSKRINELDAGRSDADGHGHSGDKEEAADFSMLLCIMERQEATKLESVKAQVAELKKAAGDLVQHSAKQRREVFGFIESRLTKKFGPLESYVPPEVRESTATCMLDTLLDCSKKASEKKTSIRAQLVPVQAEVASLTEIINADGSKATAEQMAHLHHLSELQAKLEISLEKCREVEDLDSITTEIIRYRKR